MKYLLVAFLLVSALSLGWLPGCSPSGEPSHATSEPDDDFVAPAAEGSQSSTDAVVDEGSGDALQDAVHKIVLSMLETEPDAEARQGFLLTLAQVFVDAGTPVGATVEFAIADTLDQMVSEIARVRPEGGVTRPFDPTQEAAIREQTRSFTAALRRRALPQGSPAHEGNLLQARSIEELDLRPGYQGVAWKTVGDFKFKEGMELPKPVTELAGKKIAFTGYMMAMRQWQHIREFLLVESQWSCCFGQVPDINQVLVVTMPDDHIGIDLITRPIVVYGTLEVGEEREDGWLISLYRLRAADVVEID